MFGIIPAICKSPTKKQLGGTTFVIKGSVCYISSSLFFNKFKRELCKTRNNIFLFHFKSPFCYQKNQFLEFPDIQVSGQHQMHKHKTKNTFYWINLKVNSVNEFWSVYVILQKKKSYKKLHKNCNLKTSSIPVGIRKELKGQPLFKSEPFEAAT